ncbi:hypothetical protein [Sulfitobacter sp. W074]|uniref:hypothetical protein n=1 Tax=Sulfitobacter sp. W074 TaxID=2867026 RepID=UPI0021A5A035|nr:hypothetical protein [Sulfitobacter sp. W074]UWR36174.1 hypothetical protein K3762_10165 [Sulfitobacter sp. W074]
MNRRIEQIANEALQGLTFTWADGERQLVSLPVQYPSGALTTMEISVGEREVVISDMGMGLWEAEQLCPDTGYRKIAEAEARRHGLKFDGHAVLALRLPIGSLAAGLIAVANASAKSAATAVLNDAVRRESKRQEIVYNRVRMAFPDSNVHREISIHGERADWDVHNVVDLRNNRKLIFEPVANHSGSVSAKFLMFSDLGRRSDVTLHAVFADTKHLDPKAQMIREVAKVIGEEDDVEVYRLAAA